MLNIIRTEKMSSKAWEKKVLNALTQAGVVIEDDAVLNVLYSAVSICDGSAEDKDGNVVYGVQATVMDTEDGHDYLYDSDTFALIAEFGQDTGMEWKFYGQEEVENNNTVEVEEEETTMENNTIIIIAEATLEEIKELARVTKIAKLQDEEYVSKDAMVEIAKANGMVTNRKTTRKAALDYIAAAGNARFKEIKAAEAPKQEAPKAEEQKVPVQTPQVTDAQKKTLDFMRKILGYAEGNQKRGHGYTISSEYLLYYVFEVQFGVKKFKAYKAKSGNTPEFADQMEKAKAVAKWVIDHGYITPVTYSVSFDYAGKHFERSCYKDGFDGPETAKAKMFPINACVFNGAQNVSWKVTTYAVTEKAQAWK